MPSMLKPLRKFWLQKTRYKVLYGGRGSGKSYSTAQHLIKITSKYKLKVLAIRQYQNNIRESVYTLLKNVIYDFGLQDDYEILNNMIRHKFTGSEFIFYGIARNFMEIKSMEGVDICYIEEAHALTRDQFDVIDPTIRKEDSEVWLLFNPQNRSDYVWQNFVEKPRKNSIVQKINYDENIFLSQTMLNIIEEAKEENFEHYEHIYLGKPHEGDDKALFAFGEIEDSMNGDLEGVDKSGVFSYAVDVARYGSDKSCLTKRRGYQIYNLMTYSKYSTMELANAISKEWQDETDKKPNGIFIDTIGVGAGVMDRIEEKGYNVIDANASMRADESDIYANKRAEMYFLLRNFVRKGGKLPADEELKEELLAIRYIYSKTSGKIQIQPKDDIKELIGRSPDKSDSVALHFFSSIRIEKSDFANMSRQTFLRRK